MKHFYKFIIFPLCIMLFSSFAFSKEFPRGVKLIKNGNGYTIQYSLPEYKTTSIRGGSENFTNLEIPEYGITSQVGQPQLPQVSFFLLIGKNEVSPVIKVTAQDKKRLDLKFPVYPAQMPWEKTKSLEDRPFTIDRAYYSSNGSINAPFVKVSEPFIIAGAKGVMVTIYPFAYNPSNNELLATSNGSFNIELQNSAVLNFSPRPAMDEFFASTFINYDFKDSKGTNNYLIITAPEYQSGLAPFVTHKQGLGYSVTVVNTGVTGTTNTAIKTYIQNLYNNMATRPEFILFVGDINSIPEWIGTGEGTPHTDWNYGCLEGGDQYVDAFVGRFPIANLTQLSNMITKTIYMENGVNNLSKKNVFMASTDNYEITEATHNFVIDSFFVPKGYIVNTKLYSNNGATTSQVTQSIDSGKIFAIYSGHGSETSWADGPVFSQSNVNSLNNTIFPFVYSFACITGSYHIAGECFAETWVRSPKGGVIFWGSSVNSYWDEDDILERRIERALFTENLKRNAENFVRGKVLLIQYYGSITATMQRYIEMYNCMGDPSIYQRPYVEIVHTPLPNTENMAGPYNVNCVITDELSTVTGTKLFWTRSTVYDSLTMTNTGGNNWTANIPGNGASATYKYYIRTQNAMNRVTYLPGSAPANYFTFTASTDITKPVITHTALTDVPKSLWPATLTSTVTDNIGLDSVWVRWYKNNGGTGIKHFKLLSTGGSNFSAAFNSVNADVTYNDSIFYRIFAKDNSSNHNTDSSALYKFKIINLTNICIGTGSTSSNYPFTTYWMDGRTQMLFTAAELIAGGATANSVITKIGFNILTADPAPMNGFNVKFQATTQTSLTGFVTSGTWFTGFSGSYAVPGTGLQNIDMTAPYYVWNGTSNLLVEICYDNSAYTSYSTVASTSAPGMTWGYYTDNSTGCTMTGGTAQSNRPNVCFTITTPMDVTPIGSAIPKVYSLSQNYPNPFNPVTKINFALPKQGLVTLKIYDVLGREVRTLVNEVKSAGSYSVDFNASEFSSGVYFYRLESNGFTDIKRMVLIK